MDAEDPLDAGRLRTLTEDGDRAAARASLERLADATPEQRREAVGELLAVASERPSVLVPLLDPLVSFLRDDERTVRLRTAKAVVPVAETDPAAVVSHVDTLAERLADESEFYYVRARVAEALGYIAVEHPDEVATPDVLADLRVGLSFDEPEVKTALAKALEGVALGDPSRLGHLVGDLAEHLDAGDELVRYHLCTALVAVGTERAGALTDAADALAERLNDECLSVRGRAAEALGTIARAHESGSVVPTEPLETLAESPEPFVRERARFALGEADPAETATVEGLRATTADVVEGITAPENACANCGTELRGEPPFCPECGTPHGH